MYFAIGEALQNVAKYAQASGARVTLRGIGHSLTFTVEDDGKGFDPATARMGAGVQGHDRPDGRARRHPRGVL